MTGSTAWAKHQDSKTLHLEEYNFLVAGALALALVSWNSAGRLEIKTCGLGWAIPTASIPRDEGARSCPEAERACPVWLESPWGADKKRGISSDTNVWEGLWVGDGHHSPSPCTGLPESAWLAENAYSLLSGQGWASASMPRGAGELRENQDTLFQPDTRRRQGDYNANLSIWRIEPLGTVIHKVWLGRIMRVAVSCW